MRGRMSRLSRLRRYVLGERGSMLRRGDAVVWVLPGTPPIWRRLRKPKPLRAEDGWREVGYTTDDGSRP